MNYYYNWQIMLMIMSVILALIIITMTVLSLIYIIGKRIYKAWKKIK